MSSDRDERKRRDRGADDTTGPDVEPSAGRAGDRLAELRARMRAIEDGAITASSSSSDDDLMEDGLIENASRRPDLHNRYGVGDAGDGDDPARPALRVQDAQSPVEAEPPTADHRAEKTPTADTADGRDHTDPPAAPASDPASDPTPDVAYSPLFDEGPGPARRERRRVRPEQTPTQRALGLLTRREHSRKELTRKLTSRGLDREQVVAAVDRLADAGWQNDHRFAESLIRSRAGNGYGPVHIRAELNMHGLDSEAIAQALAAYEGNWLENARDLLRRRFGEDFASDPALRRKAADLLMRRGFDGDTARNANRSCAED